VSPDFFAKATQELEKATNEAKIEGAQRLFAYLIKKADPESAQLLFKIFEVLSGEIESLLKQIQDEQRQKEIQE